MTAVAPRVERPRRSTRSHPVALMLPAALLTAALMVVPIVTTVVRVLADRGVGDVEVDPLGRQQLPVLLE